MATIATTTRGGLFSRPSGAYSGIWSWITTVDHKRIAIMYFATALFFFIVGGIEASLIRVQLAVPNNTLVSAETYNELFTMHGTTMIFLFVMPTSVAFFNLVVPLQIGARDVAFPRLNALSYWVFLFGGIWLNVSWLVGSVANDGWFSYANLSEIPYNPGLGMDFWVIGLQILGISSIAGGLNFVVTIINCRAPGMSMMRMPLFTWMSLVTSFLLILAMPVLAINLILLMFDRLFGTNFFNAKAGADPILWQHLFWLFGHPEVYILILPAMGAVSDVLPTFARKPLFGYSAVVYSGILIGFMSWGVWAHHMFTVGLGPAADAVFAITTMLIAIPTGVKIFNWIGTIWGGDLRFKTPMLFALGFIFEFVIGGISGVMLASPPADWQEAGTYFLVAHLHYVAFGGALYGLMAAFYYWFPKATGRLMNERLGKIHFWLMTIGFNIAFFPMHWLGLDGMPRRIYTYPPGLGWANMNFLSTAGVVLIGISFLVMLYNVAYSVGSGEEAGNDPWDGRTLEWTIPSPPPHYNFATIPVVHSRDPLWALKHGGSQHGKLVIAGGAPDHGSTATVTHGGEGDGHDEHEHIHMPDPSYYPIILAFGILLILAGLMTTIIASIIGVVFLLFGIYGWALEPVSG